MLEVQGSTFRVQGSVQWFRVGFTVQDWFQVQGSRFGVGATLEPEVQALNRILNLNQPGTIEPNPEPLNRTLNLLNLEP